VTVTEEREAVTTDLRAGLVLDRYRLGRRLGAGGFGAVHEAVDERLDRWVAVKVIPADGAAPDRARREARAAARLDHPGIVGVYDAGEEDGARYLVSELVEGRTLAQLQAEGELTDRDVLRVGLALCDALEHAHENGVVHRDVKPQNILVPDRPRSWRGAAKLADFGVAMLAGDDPLTRTGDVVGTLAYMAPEQAAGKRVGEPVDLYATALVLYEALAGRHPVRGASPAETARRVGRRVPSLAGARPDLPPELCEAIDAALDPDPEQRGTLAELGDALEFALVEVADEGGLVVPHPVEGPRWLPPVPPGGPRIAHALATGVLVAAVLVFAGPSARVPWVAALLAAGLVVVLPRLGWMMVVGTTVFALIVGPAALHGQNGIAAAGSAAMLVVAAFPVPLVLARNPRAWSLPVLAPILGALGLACAFPVLAARVRTALGRAALGALGALWLVLAEALTHDTLLLGPARGIPRAAEAQEAISIAGDALARTASSGVLLLAVLWAAAAVLLPWIVRGWSLAMDAVAATAWAAGLAAATGALGGWLGDRVLATEPRGLAVGAVAAALAALAGAHAPQARYWPHDDVE
jgi:hypothetical protein